LKEANLKDASLNGAIYTGETIFPDWLKNEKKRDELGMILAIFKLTEQSLLKLKDEGIPEDILTKLEGMKNQEYTTHNEFATALQKAMGLYRPVKYDWLIEKHALIFKEN